MTPPLPRLSGTLSRLGPLEWVVNSLGAGFSCLSKASSFKVERRGNCDQERVASCLKSQRGPRTRSGLGRGGTVGYRGGRRKRGCGVCMRGGVASRPSTPSQSPVCPPWRGGAAAGRASHRPGFSPRARFVPRWPQVSPFASLSQFPGLEHGLRTSRVLRGWGKNRLSRGESGLEVRERLAT